MTISRDEQTYLVSRIYSRTEEYNGCWPGNVPNCRLDLRVMENNVNSNGPNSGFQELFSS